MSDDEDNKSWVERAQEGVKSTLEAIKENGGELFKEGLTITGIVAAGSTVATFIGVELEDSTGAKMAIAAVVVGYKVIKKIRELRAEDAKEEAAKSSQTGGDLETISIEDYRQLQQNLEQVLGSHDVLVSALRDSNNANQRLNQANVELMEANQELKTAMSKYYRVELDTARDMGIMEERPYAHDDSRSIVSQVDLDSGDAEVRTMAELHENDDVRTMAELYQNDGGSGHGPT